MSVRDDEKTSATRTPAPPVTRAEYERLTQAAFRTQNEVLQLRTRVAQLRQGVAILQRLAGSLLDEVPE